jgi:hypothetical protein
MTTKRTKTDSTKTKSSPSAVGGKGKQRNKKPPKKSR